MLKLPFFSIQSHLFRGIQLRTLSFSQRCFADDLQDKNKQLGQHVLQNKLEITNLIKDKFEGLSTRYKEKHEIYYGKERDLVNYPMILVNEHHPKVRMGFIPDEWFNALYQKTGVTGPYLFFWGGILFVLQKEYLVMDHNFVEIPGMIIAMVITHKYLGPVLSKYWKRVVDKKEWAIALRTKEIYQKLGNRAIELAKEDQKCADVNIDLFKATSENIALQLETVYRTRIADLHKAVKKRLDYQVDKELSKQRFQRSYMINWIVDSVIKDFGPQQEKATMGQCISDLKMLAQTTKLSTA